MTYFSIILPTYNRSLAIVDTIDSVIQQTFEDWQLLVVSDGSTDNTEEIVESYEDPRITLIKLPTNHGHPGRPRNVGVNHSVGKILTYLDHDDRYEPDHLEHLYEMFNREQVRIATTGCRYYDSAGHLLKSSSPLESIWHPEFQVAGPLYQPSRVAYRHEIARTHGGWTEEVFGLEDWDLWFRLADAGERFVTSSYRTVSVSCTPDSRVNRLKTKCFMPLIQARNKEDAQSRIRSVLSADVLKEVRELHIQETRDWYQELYRRGEINWPKGLSLNEAIDTLDEEIPAITLPPMSITENSSGVWIVGLIMTVSQKHASRVVTLLHQRFPKKFSFIHSLLRPKR